jgi:large subunit ribosomal protein L32
MGALPKRRISRRRRGNRRSHHALRIRQTILCPECGSPTLPHTVCPSCGTYKGAKIIEVEEDKD